MKDLNKMSKVELELLGRKYGVELDRRLAKKSLVSQLKEVITNNTDEETPVLKADVVEPAPVLKEVVPAPSGQLLTERTKPEGYIDRLFADADGNLLKFATREAARSTGRRYDGKPIAHKDYFLVRKY